MLASKELENGNGNGKCEKYLSKLGMLTVRYIEGLLDFLIILNEFLT